MFIIKEALKKEMEKNCYLIKYYTSILEVYPKGSIDIREHSNEKYLYIKYREKDKIITKYCGKLDENLHIVEMIEKRNHAKDMLKKLRNEKKLLKKLEDMIC